MPSSVSYTAGWESKKEGRKEGGILLIIPKWWGKAATQLAAICLTQPHLKATLHNRNNITKTQYPSFSKFNVGI